MCTVSMIGDHYRDKWQPAPWYPYTIPNTSLGYSPPLPGQIGWAPPISRQEFDDLKRDVLEMKELLKRAKEYDERNGEPECEIDEKMDLLRRVAKLVGVELDDVLKPKAAT